MPARVTCVTFPSLHHGVRQGNGCLSLHRQVRSGWLSAHSVRAARVPQVPVGPNTPIGIAQWKKHDRYVCQVTVSFCALLRTGTGIAENTPVVRRLVYAATHAPSVRAGRRTTTGDHERSGVESPETRRVRCLGAVRRDQ